jgi:hypothetical protein
MARKIDSPTTTSRQAYVVGERQRIRELPVAVTAWSFSMVCLDTRNTAAPPTKLLTCVMEKETMTMPKSRTVLSVMACCVIAGPTLGAPNAYDGAYWGERSTINGLDKWRNDTLCGAGVSPSSLAVAR